MPNHTLIFNTQTHYFSTDLTLIEVLC